MDYSYDRTGVAKIINNYATDLPRADVKGKPTTAYVKSVGDSYGYSVQEMRASRLAGKSLDVRKAEAARYAADYALNKEDRKMASVKTYNSRLVTVALGTHSVTGFADDSFITVEPLGDGVTSKSGCDGEVASTIELSHKIRYYIGGVACGTLYCGQYPADKPFPRCGGWRCGEYPPEGI